jgi:hypothetical protein
MTGFWKRIFGRPVLPEADAIREPTLDDVFGICCGPLLFNTALKLHGEELSDKSPEDRPEAQEKGRA